MAKARSSSDKLAEYRRKRSADATPEPVGSTFAQPRLFVVQKHAARRMHYDLRLEFGGVLQSWAVPRGPSFDPKEKRLAVEVEQHPLDYADFEGVIPAGNYGAGAVIVWDRGQWEPVEDPEQGMVSGKLLFDLKGYKLRGRWTLFRTKSDKGNEWLLMKKPDAYADPEKPPSEVSVLSGLTVEEVRDGTRLEEKLLRQVGRLKAPKAQVPGRSLEPMLARVRETPFTDDDWLFELKYDGYRLLAIKEDSEPLLRYRRGQDTTALFPEIAKAIAALPFARVQLDGELVTLGDDGKPSFQRLQQRVHLSRPPDIARATVENPATLFVFDLLAFGDFDVRGLPLLERKRLLEQVLPAAGPLRYSDHIEAQGEAMFAQVQQMGLEGIMAKRANSSYQSGRSNDWLKIRADRVGDFVIVGHSPPKRSRSGFGALHLAQYDGAELSYAGRVGTGFSDRQLTDLAKALEPIRVDEPSCVGAPKDDKHTWVTPQLCCEVRYKEWTSAGQLRHPVFLGLRDDLVPQDCRREGSAEPPRESAPSPQPVREVREVSFTNLTKVFWPDEGYTKGDLIDYYRKITPWIMPYLLDRPIVLTRYPDGIHGKSFFQKDAPGYVQKWIRTEKMWSEHAQREIHYFICDDQASLLYMINMGSIPLHLWSSRVSNLQHPDWCILDLDPKEAPFQHVIQVAKAIRALCQSINLECFVKTSGSTGLHVLLPLAGQCTYEQSRSLGELLARIIARQLPDIATVARAHAARGERVYIDYVQNGHGRLLVSPFCVRPRPGAPVSATLKWTEVKKGLDIDNYTIANVPQRMKRLKRDPMAGVFDERPDLTAVLEQLAEQL